MNKDRGRRRENINIASIEGSYGINWVKWPQKIRGCTKKETLNHYTKADW